MTSRVKSMTSGQPLPLILGFSLPLMAGNVFQQLYIVVDTAVVGKALGVDALAALGAVDWLNWMMLGIVQGFTQGFAIRMANNFGAGHQEDLRQTVGASALLSALCSALLLVLGQLLALPALRVLQTPEDILPYSLLYLRIMFAGIPIVTAYNLFASILRSLGDGRTPLEAMVTASFTNIALDLLFVLVFRWGIAGAAAATLIAQALSGVFCLVRLGRLDILRLEKRHFRLSPWLSWRLTVLGLPMSLQNAIIALGGMIIQRVVNRYGVVFIAGFTAANKLYGILEIAATSYGYAMVTYTGQNLGAERIDRIKSGMRSALLVALGTSLVICAVMLLFGRLILGLFISGTPEQVRAATDTAYRYLSTMSLCLPVLYVLHVTRSAIQGMGNTVLPMLSGLAEFCMRTSIVLLLPGLIGETGIFLAEVSSWAGADVILIPSYLIMVKRLSEYHAIKKTV